MFEQPQRFIALDRGMEPILKMGQSWPRQTLKMDRRGRLDLILQMRRG